MRPAAGFSDQASRRGLLPAFLVIQTILSRAALSTCGRATTASHPTYRPTWKCPRVTKSTPAPTLQVVADRLNAGAAIDKPDTGLGVLLSADVRTAIHLRRRGPAYFRRGGGFQRRWRAGLGRPQLVGLVPRKACGDLCPALCRPTLSKMASNRTDRQSVRQRLPTKFSAPMTFATASG